MGTDPPNNESPSTSLRGGTPSKPGNEQICNEQICNRQMCNRQICNKEKMLMEQGEKIRRCNLINTHQTIPPMLWHVSYKIRWSSNILFVSITFPPA